ncbi:ferritin-like domain-containing protein [Sandaracinus amylolyticus]|uniref:ferritin-like domain-containing protein n=1 Tax=Sandaracinus amylolyticus TaxID=927083 RepID=UPI001F22AE2D|nr:ferritin-like domain-containing protein [Sandaracinus amylolyticus]UJR83040.1 Hypothetical protein I5071_51060 [Sandaracinus amylolyticus]
MKRFVPVHNREQLQALLAEAAEVEHDLMCCYLYAAFSLKDARDGDLLEHELPAIERWRATILRVALEEMTHLSLVANLMTAIGAPPHFDRSNFPISAGAHPSRLVLELAPCDRATLEHFVFLERPVGIELPDGAGFDVTRSYSRDARPTRYMPSAQDYDTVGELYAAIRIGFDHLSDELGEKGLFIGDPSAQVGPDLMSLPAIRAVTDLASAHAALDTIVLQGEGAPGHSEGSHFAMFSQVRDEHAELSAARPDFRAARPAARNPVMRSPLDPRGRVWIVEPDAAALLDVANSIYTLSLRLLCQGFVRSGDRDAKRTLLASAVDAMRAFAILGTELTRLPASPEHPGVNAGVSFALLRSVDTIPHGRSEWTFLAERARELAGACGSIARIASPIAHTVRVMERLAGALEEQRALEDQRATSTPSAPPQPSPRRTLTVVPPQPGAFVEEARTEEVALRFEGRRCIHARHCVLGEPTVFLANVQGPWLHPETVSVEALVRVAQACPSGAITYQRFDGGPQEEAPAVNTIRIRENGPLAIHAALAIEGEDPRHRATLCRCGRSRKKPFCDGSHTEGFAASGEPASIETTALPVRDGTLAVVPIEDGPLDVRGNVEICAGTGRIVLRTSGVRLCRCGGSSTKPVCDGTHARIGFRSS